MAAPGTTQDFVAPINTFQQEVQSTVTTVRSNEEAKERIKNKFRRMKQEVNGKIDCLEANVMSHAYDVDFAAYAARMEPVIDEVKVTYDGVFSKLTNFLSSLWNWLKQKIANIVNEVKSFFGGVKDFVVGKLRRFFGF